MGSMGTLSTTAPSGHPSPGEPASLTPIPMHGGSANVLGAPVLGPLSPASSSAGHKEYLQTSPRTQPRRESPEDTPQAQHFPRIMPAEARASRALLGSTSTSTNPGLIRDRNSPLGSNRRSNRVVHASLLIHDTTSSKSSSRSSNLSSGSTGPSSIYNSIEDTQSQRTLPSLSTVGLKSIASLPYSESGGQPHHGSRSNQSASTYGHTLHSPFAASSSGTFESLQLPLPYNISFQRDQPPPCDSPANLDCVSKDIPYERKSLKDLALTSLSPDPAQDLRSRQRDFPDSQQFQQLPALQDVPLGSAERLPDACSTPGERLTNGHYAPLYAASDEYRAESYPVSYSDPLSVLAYAGRMVDEDARSRSPKH